MQLSQASDKYIIEMMSWFSNEEELNIWSGPNFKCPYDLESFKSNLKLETAKSFVFISDESNFLAFGQYYLRLGKCHLARLVVNPVFRGQGVVANLIQKLSIAGKKDLNADLCSLFVLEHNKSAIKAYKKCGFFIVSYPGEIPLDNCLYMVNE